MNASTSANLARSAKRALRVGGVTPFTATDYPGQFAAVVFVQGCPWRCGYCHNPHLQERHAGSIAWDEVLALLARRVGLVDAVVFSGGEPAIDPMLASAMGAVRALGFKVGLHTACIYPARLAEVLPLVDWVGFDIKAPFMQYDRITRTDDGGGIVARDCAEMILASGVDYECRTTAHPSLLPEASLRELTETLARMGVRNYALQLFRAQHGTSAALNAAALGGYPSAATLAHIASLFPRFTLRNEA
ncbi:MAG: anaerobic ribonucleoside-triphosphate reductase activating protein [Pseudomonadota bacterium]